MSVFGEKTTRDNKSAENSCKDRLNPLVSFLASLFIRLIGKTVRLKVTGEEKLAEAGGKNSNVIYAFWHNRLFLLIYAHRNRGICVMVSRSRDGDAISRTISRFGFTPMRGSSSRGGSSALLGLSKKLRKGYDAAVTPDGPRGPRYRAQMGVIHLAMTSRCPIVPVTYCASRKLVLKSWDGLIIPCPFAKSVIIYGNPVEVNGNSVLEDKRLELERRLMKITSEADSYYS